MSFLQWIARQAARPFTSAFGAARSLWDALTAMWNTILRVFHAAVNACGWLASHAVTFAKAAARWVQSVGALFIYLVEHYIPDIGRWAINGAISWAARAVAELRSWVGKLVHALDVALRAVINTVKARVEAVLSWAKTQIDKLWATLTWTYNLVRSLLTDAEKLAVWLLPKLLKPLTRYVESQAVAIGRWLIRRAVASVPAMASLIEGVIARVL